jgi:phospholipase/carboxylesterase
MSEKRLSLTHHLSMPRNHSEKTPLLLLLHGFGANEDDLFSLSPYLDERFLIVSARAPVTIGPYSYAWFNLNFTPEGVIVDLEEARRNLNTLHKFINELIDSYQIDRGSVYLMGFSQGAMMSLAIALTYPGTAAAVVSMSGRLLSQTLNKISDKDALIGLPIFMAHGTRDEVLPIHHARDARAKLSEFPIDLTYREYDMGHEISAESIDDIMRWLKNQLDSSSKTSLIN